METIVIQGCEFSMPSPVYLLPNTVEVNADEGTITGKCYFPSVDKTVGDRVDHANICHAMFAVWNCAHIIANKRGWGRLFVSKSKQTAISITPPDTEIDFVAKITSTRFVSGRVVGSAEANFSLDNKRLVRVLITKFVEDKK